MFVVRRCVYVSFWTVTFCVPYFDVWLRLSETHGIAAVLSVLLLSFLPGFGGGEAVGQASKGEGAEGELGEESGVVGLVF